MNEIKDLLLQGVEEEHFPGASYAIVYKDGTVISDYLGYKQTHPKKIENTGNEIYDCASLTKVISTTTMVFKLIEEGRIKLSTKLYTVLPRFKHKEIEIKHLITHISGLPADIPNAQSLRNKEDVIEAMRGSAFDFIDRPFEEEYLIERLKILIESQQVKEIC